MTAQSTAPLYRLSREPRRRAVAELAGLDPDFGTPLGTPVRVVVTFTPIRGGVARTARGHAIALAEQVTGAAAGYADLLTLATPIGVRAFSLGSVVTVEAAQL